MTLAVHGCAGGALHFGITPRLARLTPTPHKKVGVNRYEQGKEQKYISHHYASDFANFRAASLACPREKRIKG
jgi:hypothetical protein